MPSRRLLEFRLTDWATLWLIRHDYSKQAEAFIEPLPYRVSRRLRHRLSPASCLIPTPTLPSPALRERGYFLNSAHASPVTFRFFMRPQAPGGCIRTLGSRHARPAVAGWSRGKRSAPGVKYTVPETHRLWHLTSGVRRPAYLRLHPTQMLRRTGKASEDRAVAGRFL